MLTLQLIQDAQARIKPYVHRTPVITSRVFDEAAGRQVFFKCENLQRAGAFKIRGAMNKLLALSDEERGRGVAAFSSGNHAQAVALAARETGTRAVIAMPTDAPQAKVAATRGYGATVVFYDRQQDDREKFTQAIAEQENLTLVPPYDDYLVMAGQGTCALEFLEEVADLDAVITPCGGGGLFAGVSTVARAAKKSIQCFAVEAESANDTQQSFRRGERVCIPPPPTIADGMRNQTPGRLTFPVLQRNAKDVLTVSDDQIIEALRFMLFRMKMLVETTGAVGAAAALFNRLPANVKRVGVVLSGGNIDPHLLATLIESNDKATAQVVN